MPNEPVYSGTSWTEASSPFTPPVNSGFSTVGAGSSPAVPSGPVYSGFSTVGAASSPAVPNGPVYSGTSWTAASLPFIPFESLVPATETGKLCILSIAPSARPVTFWPISSESTVNRRVFVSYWVMKRAVLPFANWRVGALLTNTSESNSIARMPGHFSIAYFTFASLGEIQSLVNKSQLNFL